MIQLNLLPDVKLEYIKARRTKHAVILLSTIVSGAALTLFVLFFLVVNVVQKQHLSNLNKDIAKHEATLQEKPELAKILTIQNQLNSLTGLHDQKPVASRVYGYIQQVTPQKASIETITVNFTDQTIKVEGSADSLATVNTFVDTLKFTTFNAEPPEGAEGESKSNVQAFSEVVLTEFSVSSTSAQNPAKSTNYSISFKYEPTIFGSDANVVLVVPNKVTTRSETEKPNEIFQTQTGNGRSQ